VDIQRADAAAVEIDTADQRDAVPLNQLGVGGRCFRTGAIELRIVVAGEEQASPVVDAGEIDGSLHTQRAQRVVGGFDIPEGDRGGEVVGENRRLRTQIDPDRS
jgi:hypothetical protein